MERAAVTAFLAKLAENPAVQRTAAKVAENIYGKIISPAPATSESGGELERLTEQVQNLTTRDEMIASFSALQAELDRRHKQTLLLVMAVLSFQVLTLGVIVFA